MRKISKIKLKDFHEMDEMEMRNIIGGSGGTGGSGGDSGSIGGSGCAWYRCVCTIPLSGVLVKEITRIVKSTDIISATAAVNNGDCDLYGSITCEYNKEC